MCRDRSEDEINPEACESCRLGKDPRVGKKVGGLGAKDSGSDRGGPGDVVGRRVLGLGQRGTEGFEQRSWYKISFKVAWPLDPTRLLTFHFVARLNQEHPFKTQHGEYLISLSYLQ